MRRPRAHALAVLTALAASAALAACGADGDGAATTAGAPAGETVVRTTRVEVVKQIAAKGAFDPAAIYEHEAPGVVTVISVFGRGGGLPGGSPGEPTRGLGSGFVLNGRGEIATNAHVVTDGEGRSIRRAKEVYVEFGDGNQVPARIVGFDPNADIALLRVNPSGLTLRPLPLGRSSNLVVGAPVAAIGSPFGEPQSLSVGVISAVDRSIESLTGFSISGAVQTDAAINHGNSGGPLVNAKGEVVGVNSQIRSTGGGGEGVGFAVPVDTVRRSLAQLRAKGRAAYAYLGVSTVALFPQLARRFDLPVDHGAYIQQVVDGGPADRAGLRAGGRDVRFQAREYAIGGDVVTKVGGKAVVDDTDLGELITPFAPGDTVTLEVYRDGRRRSVRVRLGERPAAPPRRP